MGNGSGCRSRTRIDRALAAQLGRTFRDADEFHPPRNLEKMSRGTRLTDDDRQPWQAAIRAYIDETLKRDTSAVVTYSALKERYRRVIVPVPARAKLVHPAGDFALKRDACALRGHFMKAPMLASLFADLAAARRALGRYRRAARGHRGEDQDRALGVSAHAARLFGVIRRRRIEHPAGAPLSSHDRRPASGLTG